MHSFLAEGYLCCKNHILQEVCFDKTLCMVNTTWAQPFPVTGGPGSAVQKQKQLTSLQFHTEKILFFVNNAESAPLLLPSFNLPVICLSVKPL